MPQSCTYYFIDRVLIVEFEGEIVQLLRDNIALLQDQIKVKDEQSAAAHKAF